MIQPTPIENLPRFSSEMNSQPTSNPSLKLIIVSGILILGVVFLYSIIKKEQQFIIQLKKT